MDFLDFQDISANGSRIYGPPGCFDLFSAIRKSIIVGYCLSPYSVFEFLTQKCIQGVNKQLQTQQQLLCKTQQKEQVENQEKQVDPKDLNNASETIKNGIFKDENLQIIPIETKYNENKFAVSYICIPHQQQGTVNAKKLEEFKIIGKDRGLLFKTGQVTLKDGKSYKAEEFRSPDLPSCVFLILDVQSEAEIQQLQENKHIQTLFKENINENTQTLRLVVHLSRSKELLMSKSYEEFLNLFNLKNCEHIFTCSQFQSKQNQNPEINISNVKQPSHIHFINALNKVFPSAFPKLQYLQDILEKEQSKYLEDILTSVMNKKLATNYFYYSLNYKKNPESGILDPSKLVGYNLMPNFEAILAEEQQEKESKFFLPQPQEEQNEEEQKQENLQNDNDDFDELIFLGTGSMCPSKLRNVSGIMIKIVSTNSNKNAQYHLLDCGEGTYNQILERYGKKETQEVLLNLKSIIITHSHSDHHLGSLHVLHEREKIIAKKLEVDNNFKQSSIYFVLPANMAVWFQIYCKHVDNLNDKVKLLFNQQLCPAEKIDFLKDSKFLQEEFKNQQFSVQNEEIQLLFEKSVLNCSNFEKDLSTEQNMNITTVQVEHCPQAYGIIIEHKGQKNQKKLTYSGDTKPCIRFIDASKDADLMIHEGTFSDDLQENATAHDHSTTKDAVMSAIKANAKLLVLTHFSQRYSKAPCFIQPNEEQKEQLDEEQQEYHRFLNDRTVLAFDQLGGKISQYQNMVEQTHYIAKYLNIDKEEDDVQENDVQQEQNNQVKTAKNINKNKKLQNNQQ